MSKKDYLMYRSQIIAVNLPQTSKKGFSFMQQLNRRIFTIILEEKVLLFFHGTKQLLKQRKENDRKKIK